MADETTFAGPDLKKIRSALGLNQQSMADALGLTATFIGLMERGERPIEARTARAAKQLLNERAPIYGWRGDLPTFDDDVAIADAVIYWEPLRAGLPPVKVAARGDQPYDCSFGADSGDWSTFDTTGRLLRLFVRFHELTVVHGIPSVDVHSAFLRVPEYRAAVEISTLPDEYQATH
ncbi:helix-turn-helix domain-containing protein [Sphingobium chungbukense]|uniref:HTH cro/C1-type domain-containing protein n=1 Tax=Sphingobium chungbukense TaxID=56193 RepID=A0A0M3AZI9_9SPHN|nr:helix-turn-helix transcriptional regulator [Sphingobium chungbukense]KKW93974.1 hypothetical protein YP76_04910 [Sphingobium chungbukense]